MIINKILMVYLHFKKIDKNSEHYALFNFNDLHIHFYITFNKNQKISIN